MQVGSLTLTYLSRLTSSPFVVCACGSYHKSEQIVSYYFDVGQFSNITLWKPVNGFFHVGLDITGPLE
jgi:hypothetical protein